ncbi:uncharacterized protein LOC120265067 [Dioscorea cayenensis subsp. rotundata]|uniref:Uncharacterized protein LOC120265067 n=1 Tax=Dioscorea cayennensis subsp. rotundata TaxID=55577 RepID=A0AB40BNB9_DIOCR|nr:uncharacterized protein LOC120265067 [Dioscorea cayenensis subsp. rotundata]
MLLHGWEDAIICRAFPLTLTEHARIWFNNLKEGSISNFNQMRKEFINVFLINARRYKDASYLLTIKQDEKENLKDYVERFRAATLEVQDLQATVAVSRMLQGTRSRNFQKSLSPNQPLTLGDLFNRATKFILSEDVMRHINTGNRDKKRKDRDKTNYEGRRTGRGNEHRQIPKLKFENFTPLSQPRSTILPRIEGSGLLAFPPKANETIGKFTDAYCRFHKTHGHSTDRCRELMNEIESLVHQGKLNKFVYSEAWRNEKPSYLKKERYEDNKGMNDKKDSKMTEKTPPILDNKPSHPAIYVIIGGETLAGKTSISRKAYARQAYEVKSIMKTQENKEPITFTAEDQGDVVMPHDDAMVISETIMKFPVERILIDNGSSVNLIYWNFFEKMNLSYDRLKKVSSPLFSFS